MTCPFCNLLPEQIIDSDSECLVINDAFPVAEGHTLILPRRHVGSFFELTDSERSSLLCLLNRAHGRLQEKHNSGAYNIGINDGIAAGQTVPHMHLHLIPRFQGDVADPRGGVRWVIPNKAPYWF